MRKRKLNNNAKMNRAQNEINDEYYTRNEDIGKEMKNNKNHFVGKIIYMNCDDPEWSEFWKFFKEKFIPYGLKKIISTHYTKECGKAYKLEYTGDKILKTYLKGDGDFRSPECIEILKTVDIIITNPPFSLFADYIENILAHNKKFLVLGPKTAPGNKRIFKFIRNKEIWLGKNVVGHFILPNGNVKSVAAQWFTNLKSKKIYKELDYLETYTKEKYPTFENYDAINVDFVEDIPKDYYGKMGVPISFYLVYNPNEYDILDLGVNGGSLYYTKNEKLKIIKGKSKGKFTMNAGGNYYIKHTSNMEKEPGFSSLDGKTLYHSKFLRLIVKRKKVSN